MSSPLRSIIQSGTKLWLDSIDPDLIAKNHAMGATGATSNPIIIADLIKTGRFDEQIVQRVRQGLDDETIAWSVTDALVRAAQDVFLPQWEQTGGNDGYVSFELDPLLEDLELGPPHAQRVARYIELGKKWSKGHQNRMIKIPATPAGLEAIEDLVAAGVTINVTLIFSPRQYTAARDAAWRGARRRASVERFKSVYSIFVSRVDVYTQQHVPQLGDDVQGLVGIVNAKRIWAMNKRFWADKNLPLTQEMIFASTGTKRPEDPADKYVQAFAGSDIQTNPPATNDRVEAGGKSYSSQIENMPPEGVLSQMDREVDIQHLEETLMAEGLAKFADPQKALLALIADKRRLLAA